MNMTQKSGLWSVRRHCIFNCPILKAFTLLLLQLNRALAISVSQMMNVWFYSPAESEAVLQHITCVVNTEQRKRCL